MITTIKQGLYANISQLSSGAKQAKAMGKHIGEAREMLENYVLEKNIFGNFPLASRCEEQTFVQHRNITHNAGKLVGMCNGVHRKTEYMVHELVRYDNNAAAIINNTIM